MDLVIRGRSQDQRGARPWETGRAGEDQSGARQDRTRGRRRTRVVPGRTGPVGVEGGAEWAQKSRKQQTQLSASVHQREPEAQGRVAAQWPSLKQRFQSKPSQ